MSIKNEIKDTVKNARDAANETLHRSTADAEHVRREVDGDEMTLGEKAKSGANELKNRLQAEADKAKREARNRT
jgi:hypothetical protein